MCQRLSEVKGALIGDFTSDKLMSPDSRTGAEDWHEGIAVVCVFVMLELEVVGTTAGPFACAIASDEASVLTDGCPSKFNTACEKERRLHDAKRLSSLGEPCQVCKEFDANLLDSLDASRAPCLCPYI